MNNNNSCYLHTEPYMEHKNLPYPIDGSQVAVPMPEPDLSYNLPLSNESNSNLEYGFQVNNVYNPYYSPAESPLAQSPQLSPQKCFPHVPVTEQQVQDLNYLHPNRLTNEELKPNQGVNIKKNLNFNPNDDAARLYKAMKGIGTDETTLIDILCKRSSQERLQISSSYKTAFGKDLIKDMKSETSGNFCVLLVSLLTPVPEFEIHSIKNAISSTKTDAIALIDLICTKNNAELIQLKNLYKQTFLRDLENDISNHCFGYFKRLLISLLNANRSDAQADLNRAKKLAKELYDAGEKRLGTDEIKFNQIFAGESLPQLKLVFEEYLKLGTGHDIEKAIKLEMSGDVKNAFLAIAQNAKYVSGYYAERLYRSMKGLGTDDNTLIRNMVLRSEIDMKEIKSEFLKRYTKTLESFIKGDCSGDYKRALLALAGDPYWK